MKAIYRDCKIELENTNDRIKKDADKTQAELLRYNKGDLVILKDKNIMTRCPFRKLNYRLYVPFEILVLS
jgi:hypothetical protein